MNVDVAAAGPEQAARPMPRHGRALQRLALKYALPIILILFVIGIGIAQPSFFASSNFRVILQQVATNAMLATGATFVILSGGIDLSVGSIIGLSGVVAAMVAQSDGALTAVEATSLGILAGLVIGLLNGFLVAVARVPSFVVTLGSMTIALGVADVMSDGRPVSGLSDAFLLVGGGTILGAPVPVVVMLVTIALAWVILTRTRLGMHIYAVGGNDQAARLAGVNTIAVRFLVFAISGLLAGVAGVILCSRVTAGIPTTGAGYELNAIAAAVIGGISLQGGRGHLLGTVFGFMIMGVLDNGLNIIDVSAFYQLIIKGAIIVCAVFVDGLATRRES